MDIIDALSGEKIDNYRFKLYLPKTDRFTEPIIKLKETNARTYRQPGIVFLKIDWMYDSLRYVDPEKPFGRGRVQDVDLRKYNNWAIDTRLIYLTPEQREKLIQDTNIPLTDLEEVCTIEKENEVMLGSLLFNEHR